MSPRGHHARRDLSGPPDVARPPDADPGRRGEGNLRCTPCRCVGSASDRDREPPRMDPHPGNAPLRFVPVRASEGIDPQSGRLDLNQRPFDPQSNALPSCATPREGGESSPGSVRSSCERTFVAAEVETRRCGRCGQHKPVAEFAWRRKSRGQRHNMCRQCHAAYHRAHYLANKQRYVDQASGAGDKLRLERTRFFIDYFLTHPCVDCESPTPSCSSSTTSATSRSTSPRTSRSETGRACSTKSRSAKCGARTAIGDRPPQGATP